MLVGFEGIDGAGKTVLARGLVERLEARGLPTRLLEKRAIPALPDAATRRLEQLRGAIWTEESGDDLLGTHFSLYLLAAWYSALARTIDVEGDEIAVVDGWFYRVVVKAFLRGGLDRTWLFSLFAHVPSPMVTVLVDIDPGLSFDRRRSFSASELGHWDGHRSGELRRDFIGYQRRVGAELRELARAMGWLVVHQDGRSLEHLLDEIERRLFAPVALRGVI